MRKVLGLFTAVLLLVGALLAPASVGASSSPCQGWLLSTAALQLPAGFWGVGPHTYTIDFYDPIDGDFPVSVQFTVSSTAPLLPGSVFLRMFGVVTDLWTPVLDATINPAQPTVLYAGWLWGPGDYNSRSDARQFLATATISYSWDGHSPITVPNGPLTDACAGGFTTTSNDRLHVMGQVQRHYAG